MYFIHYNLSRINIISIKIIIKKIALFVLLTKTKEALQQAYGAIQTMNFVADQI
jgi:hypothetical protein